jgi:CubicO group peptidase (beta-lactamase class C family)
MALGARRFLITFFLLWGFSSTPHSQAQDLSGKLRESMDSAVREHNFSGSVIVTKGGETLLVQGYELADMEHGVFNTPQTKFRIGSMTKQFTAMAIVILQEQGNSA